MITDLDIDVSDRIVTQLRSLDGPAGDIFALALIDDALAKYLLWPKGAVHLLDAFHAELLAEAEKAGPMPASFSWMTEMIYAISAQSPAHGERAEGLVEWIDAP